MKIPVVYFATAVLLCAPLVADQALFRNAAIDFGGGQIIDMKPADVNHDGKPDVILMQALGGTNASYSLITLIGNGDGTFGAPVRTPVTSSGSIAVADLDGDGNVDVVLNGTALETYRGNSDGSFTLRSSDSATNIVYSPVVLTDLNGDGKLDLVAATHVFGSFATPLVTFRGNGDGTFANGITQPGPYPQSMGNIAIGDFNGDGRTDVIESSTSDLRIATGNGDGSFNPPTIISGPRGQYAIVGDFNRDGKLDFVAYGNLTSVYLGNGNATFTKGAADIAGETYRAVSADLDGDGNLDVVLAGSDVVKVMRGNGDGTFAVRSYVANPNVLAVADYDGDHHPDVLAGVSGLVLLRGSSDGSLIAYRKSFLGTNNTNSDIQSNAAGIAVADFNGDGKPDVVSRNNGIIVMLNSGDGGFGPPRPLALPAGITSPLAFATGDVNGDGKADIVVIGTKLWTYLGNGDGTFNAGAPTVAPDLAVAHLQLADMNGDGKPDAVLSGGGTSGQLFLGNGDGTFSAPTLLPGDPSQIADFDGDGRLDFASNSIDSYTIYRNSGNGSFTAGPTLTNLIGALAVGDFNNDGKVDLVEESYGSYIRMRLGKGDGTFTDSPIYKVAELPSGPYAASTVVADFNGDGNLDLAFSNVVMLGKGDGTFGAKVPCAVSRSWPDVAAADIDGNGSADLLLLDNQNSAVNALLTRTTGAGTRPFRIDVTTSLSLLHPGETVTVTATTTQSPFIPSGGIRLTADGVFAGFGEWINSTANISWVPLSVGDHTIAVSYIGDDVFSASTSSVTRTAVKLDSVVGLSVSPSPASLQQFTSIFFNVNPRQGSIIKPTGTITIRDGETILLSAPYANPRTITNYRFSSLGTHTITADYSGDANSTAATATFAHVVTKGIAPVLLNGSPASPLTAGQSLTLTATIGAPSNGDTVTFRDFAVDLGTVTVSGVTASITIQPQPGYHSYSAAYSGNANFDPAKSKNLDYEVKTIPCAPAANCTRKHAAH